MTYLTRTDPLARTFTDVRFMTAQDKRLTLNAWQRFIKHGLQREYFTKRLYDHLIQHCSFIAHLDRAGFYATYFAQPEDTAHFFTQFDRDKGLRSVEYGMPWTEQTDYADVNQAMVDIVAPALAAIYADCTEAERKRDLAAADALLAKHSVVRKVA